MSTLHLRPRFTVAEYVRLEGDSNVRHEYFHGEIYAMAGGSPEHAALCAQVIVGLSAALAGRPCRVYTSDLRVRVPARDLTTYPDVTVICGRVEQAPEDPMAALNPLILAEVTSPSTESYDREAKLQCYQSIPSLRTILIVSHAERRIDASNRGDDGAWTLASHGPGERVALPSLGASLAVDAVYVDPLS